MREGLVVAAVFLGGELAGALVQLRGHCVGFFGWAAEVDKGSGKVGIFHGKNLTTDGHG